MRATLVKIAAQLDVDRAANFFLEAFYGNHHTNVRFVRRFQILAYHKVSPDRHPFFEPVHPFIFEQQMHFLSRCYRVMPLMELVEQSQTGHLPERAVAITFDDGYRDNYQYAFPILKKYRLPATVFVSTGVIETGENLWHDRIFDAFRFATVKHARVSDSGSPELVLEPFQQRQSSIQPVLRRAKQLYGEKRLSFIEKIEKALKPTFRTVDNKRMLTWSQIREMRAAGIDFGSHTVSHPVLSCVPHDEMAWELQESKRKLEEQLDELVVSFAYPNGHAGDYNDDAKKALERAGYTCAVTSEFGLNHALSDRYALKRGQPSHKEIEMFRFAFFMQRHGLS